MRHPPAPARPVPPVPATATPAAGAAPTPPNWGDSSSDAGGAPAPVGTGGPPGAAGMSPEDAAARCAVLRAQFARAKAAAASVEANKAIEEAGLALASARGARPGAAENSAGGAP